LGLRETLNEGFEYDLWANRQWFRALGGFKDMLRAQQVLEHVLTAQRVWLERCGVEVIEPGENIALEDLFEHYCRAWQMNVNDRPLEERIAYQTMSGESFVNTIEQIARHVINHGTYHRGQLRGIAEASGHPGFPETDFILYLREKTG
jgi:uncharacterized damage-inducible protein DinB